MVTATASTAGLQGFVTSQSRWRLADLLAIEGLLSPGQGNLISHLFGGVIIAVRHVLGALGGLWDAAAVRPRRFQMRVDG